jgi:RNA polymerase sigma-70 factor (ECF subfamily)
VSLPTLPFQRDDATRGSGEARLTDSIEQQLLRPCPAAAAGDVPGRDCFERLVHEHQPAVRRLAYRLLGWRGDIEDVVQEVFLIALRRLPTFRGESSVSTWLMGITINQCRSQRRRSLVRLRWLRRLMESKSATPLEATSPTGLAEETSQQVREAVAQLPPRDREVIVLFYLEELPVAEIAKLTGNKPNAIEVRLHRARRRLKTQLAGLIGD